MLGGWLGGAVKKALHNILDLEKLIANHFDAVHPTLLTRNTLEILLQELQVAAHGIQGSANLMGKTCCELPHYGQLFLHHHLALSFA